MRGVFILAGHPGMTGATPVRDVLDATQAYLHDQHLRALPVLAVPSEPVDRRTMDAAVDRYEEFLSIIAMRREDMAVAAAEESDARLAFVSQYGEVG